MLSHLDHSEVSKVNTRELAPNEPEADMGHIVVQARGEEHQRLFQVFSRQGAQAILVASVARWEKYQKMLIFLEQTCQELCQTVEQMSERQELLAALMESEKSLQKAPQEFQRQIFLELKELEEQKSQEALELLGQKHRISKLKKERERARMLQVKELLVVEGAFTGSSSIRSLSPSMAPGVGEETSTPSRDWKEKWRSGDRRVLYPCRKPGGEGGPVVSSDGAHTRRK